MYDIEKDINIGSVISLNNGTVFVCTHITYDDDLYQYLGFTTTSDKYIIHEYYELTINDNIIILDIYNKRMILQGSEKFENAKIIGNLTMREIYIIDHKNIQAIFGKDNKVKYLPSKGEIYDFTENEDNIKICIIARDTYNTDVNIPVYFYDYYKNHITKDYINMSVFNDDNIKDKLIYKPKTYDVKIEYVNGINCLNNIHTVTYKLLDNNGCIPNYIIDILRNTANKYIINHEE